MRQLKYFICGLISAIAFISTINKLKELINIWIESKKSKPLEKLIENDKKLAMLSDFIYSKDNIDYHVEYTDDFDDFD